VRAVADLVLVVVDRSQPLEAADRRILEETAGTPRVIAVNKIDLPEAWCVEGLGLEPSAGPVVSLSVRTGEGLEALTMAVGQSLGGGGESVGAVPRDTAAVTNLRHIDLLGRAREAVRRTREAVDASKGRLPEEFVLADLHDARTAIEEITGRRSTDDLLAHIFGRFCIGK